MAEISDAKGYDQTCKYLSDGDPVGFLGLVGAIRLDEEVRVDQLKPELITPSRPVDMLYRVTNASGSRLVHVEVNLHWRNNLPSRAADYGVRIWLAEQEPVETYILILRPNPKPPQIPPTGVIQAGDLVVIKNYRLICLWELEAREWLEQGRPHLLPLVPLMHGGEEELRESMRIVTHLPGEKERQELSTYLSVIGALRYDPRVIHQLLGEIAMNISIHEFKESGIYQEIAQAAAREAELKGEAKGEAKGRAALQEALNRIAARRFPGFELAGEIERITDIKALEDLCVEINEIPDETALQTRLSELMPPREGDSLGIVH